MVDSNDKPNGDSGFLGTYVVLGAGGDCDLKVARLSVSDNKNPDKTA